MVKVENNSNDIMMDLNIPFQVYILLFLLVIIYVVFKYFYSTEEIFEFIEKSKKKSNEADKLNLLTELNTKINRDFLDNSKYYNEVGYSKIYGNKKEKEINDNKEINKNNNENRIFIKKSKKVGFSDTIIYENDEN